MAGKMKEFQKVIVDDMDWKDTISGEHVFIEAHRTWTGPCECVKPMLYRISLDKEDIKFCTADLDKITFLKDAALKDHKDKVKPIFMYYRKSVLKKQIEGVNAPEIQKLLDNI
uniref:Thioredoxin domain-containing protein n=1 Tax=Hemiselmis andersenii TaxID=464988 RepID=A0A6U5B3U3_HEMAN